MATRVISSTGRPMRRTRADLVVGACLALAALSFWWVLPDVPVTRTALALAAALLLGNFAVIAIGPRQDSQQRNLDEVIVGAALMVSPESLPWAALVYALAYHATHPFLGVVDRVRRSSVRKNLFNSASAAVGFTAAWVLFDRAVEAGAPAALAALLAGAFHNLATGLLTAAVMLAADDGLRAGPTLRRFAPSVGAGAVLAVLGIGVATASDGVLPDAAILLGVGATGYAIARRQAPRALDEAVADSVITVVPELLLASDLDAATAEGAAKLVGAERGEVRTTPPGDGEIGVELGTPGDGTWLVVGGRLGAETDFDEGERRLLAAYARLAAPARDHARAVDRLSASDDARATILRAIGHDLRSPLAVAGSAVRTLVEHGDRLPSETRREVVASIVSHLDRSAMILDDLLELERRHTEPDRDEVADLTEVLMAVGRSSPDAVTVVPGPPVQVATDARLLQRVLDNLVQNALRHGSDSEVVLWWWEDDGSVTIAVDDGGDGVPLEERERILRPFTTTSEDGVGVGLGLHLAVSFAEMAGGRLQIADSERGGASFRVVLPVLVPAESDARTPAT